MKGEVPESIMIGTTADISNLISHKWYDWIVYRDPRPGFPEDKELLGRYLRPTEPGQGSTMSYFILTEGGKIIRRVDVRPLTLAELESESHREARRKFDREITEKLGSPYKEDDLKDQQSKDESNLSPLESTPHYEPYEDEQQSNLSTPDVDTFEPEGYDSYITAEVLLPKGDDVVKATVTKRVTDSMGNPVGRSNTNPILDSRLYEVRFSDGEVAEYTANVIAQNIYSRVNEYGDQEILMDRIVDHKVRKDAVSRPSMKMAPGV